MGSEYVPSGSIISYADTLGGTYTSIGILKGDAPYSITGDNSFIKGSRGEEVISSKRNQAVTISGSAYTLDMDTWQAMLPGFFTESTVAGTVVTGATQTFSSGDWSYSAPVKIENQNGDGSVISVTSVTGGTDGLLVEGTDYFVGIDANGDSVITTIDSTTVTTESQDLDIVYDYTPNASKTLSFGQAATSLSYKFWKLTYINPDNDETTDFYIYKGVKSDDFVLNIADQATDDALFFDFEIQGVLDITRTAKDQLGKIVTTDSTLM